MLLRLDTDCTWLDWFTLIDNTHVIQDFLKNRLTRWHNPDVQGVCNLFQGWHGWHKADTFFRVRHVPKPMNSLENLTLRARLFVLRGRLSVQFSREFTSFACSADRESCLLTALPSFNLKQGYSKICAICGRFITSESCIRYHIRVCLLQCELFVQFV